MSTLIIAEMIKNDSSDSDEVLHVETRGRKSKLNIPVDKKYSTGYYQANKTMVKCECGANINKRCLIRHLKCDAHAFHLKARQLNA
jgi:hypothetical protein